MHSLHSILVHVPTAVDSAEKKLSEMTKEELKEAVINYATGETERFSDLAFDSRTLLDELYEDDGEDYRSVIFAHEDWATFEEVLLSADRAQKGYAKHLLEYLEEETGTLDLSKLLSTLLLANDRTASRDSVDPRTWRWDFLNQSSMFLLEIARLIRGKYYFGSGFYDTYRDTALVPFIDRLKEKPEEWALVRFDYHY